MRECYFCKGKIEEKYVTVDYRWGDSLTVIEKVPAGVCEQCGERYYDAKIAREMEQIALSSQPKPERYITVPVQEFQLSAVA